MKAIKNLIVGSGISSLVCLQTSKCKVKVISDPDSHLMQSKNFYEDNSIGGNTNIWGGYINHKRHLKFFKNTKYRKFFKNKFLDVKQIFKKNSKFSNTYCLVNEKNEVFRINKLFFKNFLLKKKVNRINIKKKSIELVHSTQTILVKNLTLCMGNLNLIKLLYNSNWIKPKDVISFDDSSCSYVFNFLINQKKNYYIPMPLNKIIEKIIFGKSKTYDLINDSIILQKFSGKIKNHKIICSDLIKMNESKIRYFLSNHIVNIKINNIPIRKFVNQRSKKINVFCSGTLKKYLPGPIIQDLIFDIIKNR